MRLTGFVRAGRALAPLIAAVVVLGVLYGGGAAQAGEAYGVSAVVLFPVLAWQSKLLLDAEPDVQRRLVRVTAGARREVVAGLLAAGVAAVAAVAIALVLPWLVGGIRGPQHPGEPSLVVGLALGVWAHLLAVPAGVALGALASRAVTGGVVYGLVVLFSGMVGAVVLGLRSSVVPVLAPPLMDTARALTVGPAPSTMLLLTGHALLWSAVVLTGYSWLRRTRS